jgi:uncharacterized protein YjbI with pentapeptide repeats
VANEEHVKILKQGVEVWNAWLDVQGLSARPDLSGADLSGADLHDANLEEPTNLTGANLRDADLGGASMIGADLRGADLSHTSLHNANLTQATLRYANLSRASLCFTHLIGANLHGADLHGADLQFTNLSDSDLSSANLTRARLLMTNFGNVDLTNVIGLETCEHIGPSTIDHRTLQKSGPLPLAFLRGVGLPNMLIDYLPSLLNQAIQRFSCFISYSTHDEEFAKRLHADLQDKGVRCWFAPHDMRTGEKILDSIDEAIRLREKVLLILSKHSIKSNWVEKEVKKALEEEDTRKPKQTVLFPIRLDDAVMKTKEAWAGLVRRDRNIGDFRQWKDHDAYQQSFQRILRDLAKEQPAAARHAEGDA